LDALCHEHAGETNPSLLVSIGARSATLVFRSPAKAFVRTFSLGGNGVTRAIATELGTDFDRAEALKLEVSRGTCALPAGSALRAAVRSATAGYGLRLSAEIRQTLACWQRELDVSAATQVRLIGGGADLSDLPAVLERELGMRVRKAELFPQPGIAAATTEGVSAEIIAVARSVLVGPSRLVSLLPPALKRALAARRREPLQLAAAVSVVVVLFLVLWHVRRQASATSARLGPLRDEIRVLEVRQAKHTSLIRQIQDLRKRNERLRPAELARSSWVEFFDDLQARLTAMENVWFDRLQIVPSSEASEAKGQKRLRLSGRMLEAGRGNPLMLERANTLLAGIGASRFVAAIEGERFEPTPEGLLGFEVTLLLNPEKPL
jgi:type IV pilus assembly protein PilM